MPVLITDPPAGLPPLPSNFAHTAPPPELRYQGAEALVYFTYFPFTPASLLKGNLKHLSSSLRPLPAFLKHRPRKPYRHPILDAKLTRHRILSEARVLVRLRREGVSVPALYALDWDAGWMLGEWIPGEAARAVLDEALPRWILELDRRESESSEQHETVLTSGLKALVQRIGRAVGRMHEVGVVHGDLTTSNLLLRFQDDEGHDNLTRGGYVDAQAKTDHLQGDVVIIDFGLAMQSKQEEDRAVDLYVLERAFGSSHPRTESLFEELLRAYGESYQQARIVLKRLEDVRMRGRKKLMIG